MTARIVVIDDDHVILALLDTLLTEAGYHPILWDRAQDAHELIRTVQPDLVILDLWLEHPGAGGMVLGLLAVDPTTRHLPVLVCTAFRQLLPAQVSHLQGQGYVLLEKPFDLVLLLGHVRTLLDGEQARAVGGDRGTTVGG
jgi:two-component system nitrogen regulation response regulator GlnG